jgi:hypothetical protein
MTPMFCPLPKLREIYHSAPTAGAHKRGSSKGGFAGKALLLLLALRTAIPELLSIFGLAPCERLEPDDRRDLSYRSLEPEMC